MRESILHTALFFSVVTLYLENIRIQEKYSIEENTI